MGTISDFIAELVAAQEFESSRVKGYEEILSFPSNLLGPEARMEVDEALGWSLNRLNLITNAINYVEMLNADGYPARITQTAPGTVINELKARLLDMTLAVSEFSEPPIGTVDVSEEIAV